jgi:hypothetical protein
VTTVFRKILSWLGNRLFGSTDYVQVSNDKFLKIRGGNVSLVDKHRVPSRYYEEEDEDEVDVEDVEEQDFEDVDLPTEEVMRQARIEVLESKNAYKVAQRAGKNSRVRSTVLQNPELVNADSRTEADLKIDLAKGEDITSTVESNPKLDVDSVESMMETDFMARWGYNQYGEDLPAEIEAADSESSSEGESSGEADPGEASASGEGDGMMGTNHGSGVGDADAAYTGGPTTDVGAYADAGSSDAGGSSSSISGVETGVSIDTDAGAISTGGDAGTTGSSSGTTGSSGSSGTTGAGASTGGSSGGATGTGSGSGASSGTGTGTGSGGSGN